MKRNFTLRLDESTPSSSDELYKVLEDSVELENETEWLSYLLAYTEDYFEWLSELRGEKNTYDNINETEITDDFEDFIERLYNDTRDIIIATSFIIRKLVYEERDTPENNTAFNFLHWDIEVIYRQARNAIVAEMNRLLDIHSKSYLPKK